MRLTSASRDFVDLRIDSRPSSPFSPAVLDAFDESWLYIAGGVRVGDRAWTFRDPCLTVPEAVGVERFLRSPHERPGDLLDFLEPHLSLRSIAVDPRAVTVRVVLRGEAAPPDVDDILRWDVGFAVDLVVPRETLSAAADDWARELRGHPGR